MSLEAAIYDILSGAAGVTSLVGGSRSPRIFPVTIPQGKSVPAVVFQQIGSDDLTTCDGPGDFRTDRVQITCWADDPDDARSLAEEVRDAMQSEAASGSLGSVTVDYCCILDEGDAINLDEPSERLHRYGKRQDYEIAYRP